MVMAFFRKGESGLDQIANRAITMLGDARHSFDLASAAVLSGVDPGEVGEDIRQTDERINRAEQELRGELVVHVSVHGADDIGEVLGYTLLIKKIESAEVQITVIEMPADANEWGPNVTRWANQVGMGDLPADQMAERVSDLTIDGVKGKSVDLVDLESDSPTPRGVGLPATRQKHRNRSPR